MIEPRWHMHAMGFETNASQDEGCHLNCSMETRERGEFDVVVSLRLITASLSIIGTLSIIGSAVCRKTVCNPKVHPIFVLSIVDTLLSVLWISGAVVWLTGGLNHYHHLRVGCFAINCMTVILQCVAMNVTLIYALLAYSSIKQRDFTGVYMLQGRSESVWPPLCSFTAYLIAWTVPILVVMIAFGVVAQQYKIVEKANNCSCWCLPYYGNLLPRAKIGHQNGQEGDEYMHNVHYFVMSYSIVLIANFTTVFCCMAVIYLKAFYRIKRMTQKTNNENTPLYGANQAVILAGHKEAKKRVLVFFSVYLITGAMTFVFGLLYILWKFTWKKPHHKHDLYKFEERLYILLFFEAAFVPSQGFMNALAYGWTRGNFLSAMSKQRPTTGIRPQTNSLATSLRETDEEEEEREVEDEKGEWERREVLVEENSLLLSHDGLMTGERRQRRDTALTPVS